MIWPQQYHNEKQGMQAQIDALEARCERLIKSIEFAWRGTREANAAYQKAIASISQPVEMQGSRWPEEGSVDVTFRSSLLEEAQGVREALEGFVQEAKYISDAEFRTSLRAQGISAGDYAAGRLMDLLPSAEAALAASASL